MWQTKYALAVPKNLGVGVDFRPCSEGDFLTGHPLSVMHYHVFDLTLVYLPYQLFSFDVNSCNTWHFHLVCERKVDFWKFQNTLTDCRCRKADTSFWSRCDLSIHQPGHGLQTPGEEIAFTARPKINSDSQIFRYGWNIFCLPQIFRFLWFLPSLGVHGPWYDSISK